MATTRFAFTNQIELASGSHILYSYGSSDAYLNNAISFIRDGLSLGQQIVLVDSASNYLNILAHLRGEYGSGKLADELVQLHFVDREMFYYQYGVLHVQRILHNLEKLFGPMLEGSRTVRAWGHVYWKDEADIYDQLVEYERECEHSLGSKRIIGVCAYDGNKLPVAVQNEMLKSHEYLMSDTALARSPFYGKTPSSFPSPHERTRLQSEMNLYKQKLDFVHVISHEVRNPLTVIKAYATMLLGGDSRAAAGRDKLEAIVDYVDVIDHELEHIISTEQMLSTDSLWERTEIEPAPVVEEVGQMMTIKARTQNIVLHRSVRLKSARTIGNATGLRLVVSNLLSNAIKYSEEGSRVWLEAEDAHEEWITVRVRDEGCGMTRDQLEKLYRKYEKTNAEKGGQGIGLFMVKKLVDHFEGEIEIASEAGVGTEAIVRLPRTK